MAAPPDGKTSGPERVNPERPSVLLAEDDGELRALLSWSLRQEGFRVTECGHGVALLDHLGASVLGEEPEEVFDLVISDIRMPGVSGLTVLEGLRGRKEFPPIILITAFGDEETHDKARRFGAVALFDKPFGIEDLLRKAREVVSGRGGASLRSDG
jgi:DNA-binding response OmpR family regulator